MYLFFFVCLLRLCVRPARLFIRPAGLFIRPARLQIPCPVVLLFRFAARCLFPLSRGCGRPVSGLVPLCRFFGQACVFYNLFY